MPSSCVMSWFSSVLFEKRLFLVFSRLPTAYSVPVFTPNSQLSLSGTLNWDISWFASDGPIYSVAIISLSLCRCFLSFFLCSIAIAVVCLRYYTIYYMTSSASAASGFGPVIACRVHKWPICRSRFKSQLVIVSEHSPSTRWQPVSLINEFQCKYVIFSHFSSLFCTHATGHQLPPKRGLPNPKFGTLRVRSKFSEAIGLDLGRLVIPQCISPLDPNYWPLRFYTGHLL